MNRCSIIQFQNAMLHPEECLLHYSALRIEPETLVRTKHFAECKAEYLGKMFMVYAPITTISMAMIEKAVAILPASSKHISRLHIAKDEMLCVDIESHRCSIILEPLPEGIPLTEALYTHTNKHLTQGMEELRDELSRLDISINHLHPDSIIVDHDYHWHVIRPYYASYGYGDDAPAFDELKGLIDRYSLSDSLDGGLLNDGYGRYVTRNIAKYPICEGLRRFNSPEGIGFMDIEGRVIIEAQFFSASDFTEDRSVIETHDHKMGIIDRRGRYVIEPIYDNIEFDTDYGVSHVVNNGCEARFDYFGKQLSDWEEIR